MSNYDIDALQKALGHIKIETNSKIVQQKSRDFYWYSPVLKELLAEVSADIVVTPANEDEVIQTVRACYDLGIPITPRGTGTGNYGQAMPLSGGVVLNLAEMNRVISIAQGRVVCEAGAICAEIDRQTQAHSAQELRMHPSTANTATIGGFVAGGSGGIGSINWGGLRDIGNVLGVRIVTMEAQPKIMELRGEALQKVLHAYGTNGIITQVEMPLTAAYDWVDVIVGFDDFSRVAQFADRLGNLDGLLTKLICVVAAPAPEKYFLRHKKFLNEGQSVCLCMVAPQALEGFLAFCDTFGGDVVFNAATQEDLKGLPPVFELSWNHTTLRALRVDPEITYQQVLYPHPNHLERVEQMDRQFKDQAISHLEFVRLDGNITCFGLPMIRYESAEKLEQFKRYHEDNGCPIFDAHRYTLEEGGMKQTDPNQLAFKREADPKGLLNPGKMVAWDNPDFDFTSGQTWLFRSLEKVSARKL